MAYHLELATDQHLPDFADAGIDAVPMSVHLSTAGKVLICRGATPQHSVTLRIMTSTIDIARITTRLFSELVDGVNDPGGAFMLNSGDAGLLRSLDRLSAAAASRSLHGGATIAAHAQHLRYGLSLMNRWVDEGGNPFADAKWEAAWKTAAVSETEWEEIRSGLCDEAHRWTQALASPRDVSEVELTGMIASIPHLAYHLGAIRQIDKDARGPKEGTYA